MDKRLHMSVLRSLVDSTDPREQVAGRPPQLSPKTAAEGVTADWEKNPGRTDGARGSRSAEASPGHRGREKR